MIDFISIQYRLLQAVVVCLTTLLVAAVIAQPSEPEIEALRKAGFKVVQSTHLTLVTDAHERDDVSEFNDIFEKAVIQWCEYFSIPLASVEGWHITGCVMLIDKRFADAGLMGEELPQFPAGYQLDDRIWLYVQDGDYYTRHLLLHEGTHAFMQKFLGGYGPAWYAEGMAELLGVHQWKNGNLTINHHIADRDEVPYWGRVKLVRQERDSGNGLSLEQVLTIEPTAFQEVRTYGWAWAACEFFDSHPDFQATFRKLPALANIAPDDFNDQFRKALSKDWPAARRQWQSMVDEIEYGYDVAKAKPVDVTNRDIAGNQVQFDLAVDRGWQNTGIEVQPDRRYRIAASGIFQVKKDSEPWPCDAGGVTLEYYRGRPLGQLIATIDSGDLQSDITVAGLGGEFTFDRAGTLFLRINESPAALQDNIGQLKVQVVMLTD